MKHILNESDRNLAAQALQLAKCDHDNARNRTPSKTLKTVYGTFEMCETCANRMPQEYLKPEVQS